MFEQYGELRAAQSWTAGKLTELRKDLDAVLASSSVADCVTLVTTGSYGRGEASSESDLDWYPICEYGDADHKFVIPEDIQRAINATILKHVPNQPGSSNTFGSEVNVPFGQILKPIGGQLETNQILTRRLLLLLEGAHLYGLDRLLSYRSRLLKSYLPEDRRPGQLPRFLLNDTIRFYRTMLIDFENKVRDCGKNWGLRNVKLRFSRKLLFFGGLVTVAELTELANEQALERGNKLLSMSVLERIGVCGGDLEETETIFQQYNGFLEAISDTDLRDELDNLKRKDRHESKVYQELRQRGVQFSKALDDWIKVRYDDDHPIHHSLLF